ncbi:MAG: diaminopimelate epimerase [Candidatus Omnitrophota bacterium]
MKTIGFTKAVATGNDFIIIDNRVSGIGHRVSDLAKKLCDRRWSVGADGLLLVERSKKADFKMRIFNPDGSEAEMCGNGSRCIALYAATKKIAGTEMGIETLAGVLKAYVKKDTVKVRLSDPKDIKWNLCLTIHECPYQVNFVNTGVPHAVHFVKDADGVDVKSLGSDMRYHKEFSPYGSNVDFVEIVRGNRIKVRTYERGVEDETLACGTGAVASAIISAEAEKISSPVIVETKSGERLNVYFEIVERVFTNVYLEGRAQLVYEGKIKI